MTFWIRLAAGDNVVTASHIIKQGKAVEQVIARQIIPSGHKIATKAIRQGETVIKYSQIIGYASCDIAPGDHVHSHNLAFRDIDQRYEYATDLRTPKTLDETQQDYFQGFRRKNGQIGTRNYIAILSSVNCSATAARYIANAFGPEELAPYPNIDGVCAFVHATGCGMADNGEGFAALQRVMWGYARHSNHIGVLLVGLGCEMNQIDWLLEAYQIERSDLFQTMNIQNVAGLRKTVALGIEKVKAMLPIANRSVREACPASALCVALQCGGSDGWSGITANPALGWACDVLIKQGAGAVLAETPEIYGAQHLLTKRARNEKIGKDLVALINWWRDYTARNHASLDNNPSPGNKKGGLTTILEKSLGAIAKAGTTPLCSVLKYGESLSCKGLAFMDSPGYDPASVTGQIATGCNLVAFTTGRGSAFGCKPAPCVKIATNSPMYHRMKEDMDVNAGAMISENIPLEEKGQEIYDLLLRVASGEKSKSEQQGMGDYEFVPWQIGATL